MSSSRDLTAENRRSAETPNAETNAINEPFFGRKYCSRQHRCHRCNRFFGRCRCNRRMFHSFRNACMCGMMLKLMLAMAIVFLVCKAMGGQTSGFLTRPFNN